MITNCWQCWYSRPFSGSGCEKIPKEKRLLSTVQDPIGLRCLAGHMATCLPSSRVRGLWLSGEGGGWALTARGPGAERASLLSLITGSWHLTPFLPSAPESLVPQDGCPFPWCTSLTLSVTRKGQLSWGSDCLVCSRLLLAPH